ncbi:ATP-binding protein [Candidatus Scalindua japonica]|uniref:ATP-binding protein n=1 Tax=Candidatus Scalindua japonica TaxID=1284222 RepID=UPI0013A56037|nr:ATP-binding protein [Candidatus Scalindua japonica]
MKSGDYVKITLEDQGEGISKEVMQKIFDPFFSTKKRGSGLGLASCYFIIRNHGGYISAESEVGAGTTFQIYLPALKEKRVTKDKEAEYTIVGNGKILLMDDDDALRDVTGKLLMNIGYEVKLAREGKEAINMYKEAKGSGTPFNAVILDLTIRGGMGGKETIKKLIEFDPQVKAIVLSGYSEDQITSKFRKYGFMSIVKKPYEVWELNKILCDVITGTDD